MSRSISNRCERNTATPMDNGMSSKDNEKPASRSSSVSGVSPPTNERPTGSRGRGVAAGPGGGRREAGVERRQRERRIPADQRAVHRQLEREGARDTQGQAEHDPLGLLSLRRRRDPAETIDLGPDHAHYAPQEYQVRNSL